MPIMASQGRSDARGTAQLLAGMALDCIANPAVARERQVALNNVYRLLESYRVNRYFGSELRSQGYQNEAQRLALKRPVERHVKEVRDALEYARKVAFGDASKDDALQRLETVLRLVTYPDANEGQVSDEDQQRATQFFRALGDHLRVGLEAE
ncbi:MAG: hypothetical protein WBD95_02250 [Xanthobacteraceae bacterium]